MNLYSTNDSRNSVSLREAVLRSLPKDGGLYMPAQINKLERGFVEALSSLSFVEIAYRIAQHLIGSAIPEAELRGIVERSITFPAPVVPITEGISTLELFHGPSLAFKDFGARFMAQLMAHFTKGADQELTILVATSGDTGGAVAAGFHNTPGIEVIILYPSGRVSNLQEKQLTTLGGNIHACEIEGSFDDCQRLVKEAFLDQRLSSRYLLSSANSINIARLIPQTFYYFEAYKQCDSRDVVFSVPSGNFGNLTAGLMAKQMGLPVSRFLAATNANQVVPQYLKSGTFEPQLSISTISNAMDVGNPSNFSRMLHLYGSTWNAMARDVLGYSFTDPQTKKAISDLHSSFSYVADPHGAVGYLAADQYISTHPNQHAIFLETAHPAKFLDIVQETISQPLQIPTRLSDLSHRKKEATLLSSQYTAFSDYLLSR